MTLITFRPDGPHDFSACVGRLNNTRVLDSPSFRKWLSGLAASQSRGVYIVALQNKSAKPWYVGMTKRSFALECSTPATIGKINLAIQSSKGTPVLHFLVGPAGTAGAAKGIAPLEREMIQWAFALNPKLTNIHHTRKSIETSIQGVLRSGKGSPSRAALSLRGLLRV